MRRSGYKTTAPRVFLAQLCVRQETWLAGDGGGPGAPVPYREEMLMPLDPIKDALSGKQQQPIVCGHAVCREW